MCTFAQLSISPSTCLRNCFLSLDPDGKNKDKAERDIEKNKDRLCESPIEKGMGMLLSFSSISEMRRPSQLPASASAQTRSRSVTKRRV